MSTSPPTTLFGEPLCPAVSPTGRQCCLRIGHLTEDSPRLHWDGGLHHEAATSYWGELPPGRREVIALGYAEDVSRGATYRVLSWLPGVRGVPEAVDVEDDAGTVHVLGRDCAVHEAVPFATTCAATAGADLGLPWVCVAGTGAELGELSGDPQWVIEPPAGYARGTADLVVDPQHGAHDAPGHHVPAADDAACSWTWSLPPDRRHGRVVLRADAGVDDFVAAAAFWRPSVPSRETWARIRLVADADNAVMRSDSGDWAPGQTHTQVGDGPGHLPGIWRICACRSISLPRRVQLVWQWCLTGTLTLAPYEMDPLGLPPLPDGVATDYLAELATVAREQLAADRAGLAVRLTGPSESRGPAYHQLVALVSGPGRGAFAVGYGVAPICVAVSPPDASGARLATVGRASNARQVTLDLQGLVARLSSLERDRAVCPRCGVGHAVSHAQHLAGSERLVVPAEAERLARAAQWGGNAKTLVIGSPKPGGTYLDPDLIVRTVLEFSAWVTP